MANYSHKKDISGQRFGRLVAFSDCGRSRGQVVWKCHCDCGNEVNIKGYVLRSGGSRSCGCLQIEGARERRTTHGHTLHKKPTPEYVSWGRMMARCRNPKSPIFQYYGGRGILVCERWESFENFLADMGRRPSLKHSVERNNNAGNYEPGNCRWATKIDQANNMRSNRKLTAFGKTMSISLWARTIGIKRETLRERLKSGLDIESALLLPVCPGANKPLCAIESTQPRA